MPNAPDQASALDTYRTRIGAALERCLPPADSTPCRLHEAMRYVVLGPGKRVRPALCYATGETLGIPLSQLDGAACAVELIHAYSLVHDDLPAMDDDDLRRGKPTCHRAFDEATAILVGDALQALAFECLCQQAAGLDTKACVRMIKTLAVACGSVGMVGGQAMDLAAEASRPELTALQQIHERKTGALIRASVLMAADAALAPDDPNYQRLEQFACHIGLAFQIQDDILDVTADTATLGKRQGADEAREKATYPALLGLEKTRQKFHACYQNALLELEHFGAAAKPLKELSGYLLSRDR